MWSRPQARRPASQAAGAKDGVAKGGPPWEGGGGAAPGPQTQASAPEGCPAVWGAGCSAFGRYCPLVTEAPPGVHLMGEFKAEGCPSRWSTDKPGQTRTNPRARPCRAGGGHRCRPGVEGAARKVTDMPTLERVANLYAALGWPA